MDDHQYVTNPRAYGHYHHHNYEEDEDLDLMKDQSLPKT